MTAGTSALLMVIGGGAAGVIAWADDAPTVNTAGPEEVAVPAVPGGIGGGATAPIGGGATAPEDPPTATPTPGRAPGSVTDVDPAPVGGGLAMGLDPATVAAAPKATKTPKTSKTQDLGTRVSTAPPPKPAGPPKSAERPKPAEPPTPADRPRTVERPAPAAPVITTRTEVETHAIPFRTRLVRDPALPRGTKDVQAEGEAGVRSLRYLITLTDGRRTDRRLLGVTVTKRPEPRLVVIGVGREVDPDTDEDDPWDCRSGRGDLCVPFGRSSAMCEEADEPDAGGSGAGMIVLGDSVIDDEDLGLPDGYNWAC